MGKLILMGIAVFLIVAIPLELGINNLREKSRSAAEASSRFIAANAGREAAGYSRKPPPDQETHRVDLERCTAEGLGGRAHDPITGVVAGVVDGDTLRVTVDGIEMRVRLWGIDAPGDGPAHGVQRPGGMAWPSSLRRVPWSRYIRCIWTSMEGSSETSAPGIRRPAGRRTSRWWPTGWHTTTGSPAP